MKFRFLCFINDVQMRADYKSARTGEKFLTFNRKKSNVKKFFSNVPKNKSDVKKTHSTLNGKIQRKM